MFNRFTPLKKKTGLFIITCLLIFSCEEAINFTIEEQSLELSDNAEIAITYPKLSSSKNSSLIINKGLENYMASQLILDDASEVPSSLVLAAEKFDNEFKTFKASFPDSAQQWEAFIDAEVTHQSSELICIAVNTYVDTGGAHGNSHIHFLNFDPESGTQYATEDLITAPKELEPLIKAYLKEEITKNSDDDAEDLFFGQNFKLPESIGFNEEGVIILYHPYELATYTQTIVEFTIPFEEISAILLRY